jgi:hypothetical protein
MHQKLKPKIKQMKDRKNCTVSAVLHALGNAEVTKRQKKIPAAADLSVKDTEFMARNLLDVFSLYFDRKLRVDWLNINYTICLI